ncbi:replication-relaxation family protein [Streptomyces sp. NPDC057438]|uniref:replication-relaxation family protein n=1 Tax=Streptomyces sp. NPDC057438 TaxID=3346133 RepID=UPI0036A8184E
MIGVNAGSGDRLALGVLTRYRMATTEQMHQVIASSVRTTPSVLTGQTRRRLARLRGEGVVDRITLPQAGRTRAWFPTPYGVQAPLRTAGRRPSSRAGRRSKRAYEHDASRAHPKPLTWPVFYRGRNWANAPSELSPQAHDHLLAPGSTGASSTPSGRGARVS